MTVFERSPELTRILRPPRLRTLEDDEVRHASHLELFFDVVFVVAIAQLAHELVVDHSLTGFARFAALYLPVFIAWQGFSIYADRFDTDDVLLRVVMLVGMLAIAALAVQIPDVTHGDGTGFAIAYVCLRSLMIGLYLRSYRHVPAARPLIVRYAGGYSLGVALWLVSLAFGAPERYVLWGIALAWEYSLPTLTRRFHEAIPVHPSHVPERFALFTIIVLGESLVAVALGTADSEWHLSSAVIAALGFFAAAAIWWIYFGSGSELALERSATPILVFAHAHIPLLAALTAVAAGMTLAIEQGAADHLDRGSRSALAGGAALYLLSVTAAQRATVLGFPPRTIQARAVAVIVLLALILLGGGLDPLVFTALTTAVLVALVVFKLWSVHRAAPATR
ncbi:MAG TPA: low temperature requirement protein A [Gaiellaceae bacterium]|nr:low temperature requirement protein A [Gaiellaceae bacterium]